MLLDFGEPASAPVIAYHFTTETAAGHIRSQGFLPSEELFGSAFVWLTRNPDDPIAQRHGPVRLTVTINRHRWLILSQDTVRSRTSRHRVRQETDAAMRALGRRDDETLNDFVRRNRCAGIWYTDPEQPWLAVLDPCTLTLWDG